MLVTETAGGRPFADNISKDIIRIRTRDKHFNRKTHPFSHQPCGEIAQIS
jgi:hypothetical protein